MVELRCWWKFYWDKYDSNGKLVSQDVLVGSSWLIKHFY